MIELGSFGPADLADAYRLWSDFETVKHTNWAHTPTLEACAQRLERVLRRYGADPRHFGPYAIRVEGRFAGLVGADVLDGSDGAYDLWYILLRSEWGRGIATRAVGELLRLMSASGRARTATATVVTSNPASWKLLERHGFTRQGLVPGGHQQHGLSLDLFTYARPLEPA
jgi:RimJ/RimL family protein N-acetyltransferase